jgi:hypothetical protein
MMYVRMPILLPDERFENLPAIDFSTAHVDAATAWARSELGGSPYEVRLGMLQERPVFRFVGDNSRWCVVFADDGSRLAPLSELRAVEIARAWLKVPATAIRHEALLTQPDQWTLSTSLRSYFPLHRLSATDGSGTDVYVSGVTGEVVLRSTRRERRLSWLGSIPHWIYLVPIRRYPDFWAQMMMWLAALGSILCVMGIAVGWWRLSPGRRFHLRGIGSSASPYAGWKRLHHFAGLIFGLFTLTWVLSGFLSLTPWNWSPGRAVERTQALDFAGGPLEPAIFRLTPQEALERLKGVCRPREMLLVRFRSKPFYVAYQAPAHSLVILADGSPGPAFDQFRDVDLLSAAQESIRNAAIREADRLDETDEYYEERFVSKRLPVLRVKFADGPRSWLYIDPFSGRIVERLEIRGRIERWIYNGLHSLNFPFLYRRRPLWEAVVILLSLGGFILSITSVVIGFRRVRLPRITRKTRG